MVYYTESLRLAREQLETSTAELEKSRKLFELGLKSAADVAEVESQCASDDYLVTQQENNLALAEIALSEAMNFPADRPLRIDTEVEIETPAGTAPLDEVLGYALENNPKAVAARHNVRHSRLQFSVAKGNLYPRDLHRRRLLDQLLHEPRQPLALPHLPEPVPRQPGILPLGSTQHPDLRRGSAAAPR